MPWERVWYKWKYDIKQVAQVFSRATAYFKDSPQAQKQEVNKQSGGGGGCNQDPDDDEKNRNQDKVSQKITTQEANKTAEELGFKKINERTSNNQPIYKKGNKLISPDADRHNNGYWKMADSVKNLERRTTRLGTYNKYLTTRIGD